MGKKNGHGIDVDVIARNQARSDESDDAYRKTVSAWKDSGQESDDPGAITYKGGEVPNNVAFDKVDKKFYGHFLPSHFKKTSIITTHGR
jgi:hypothetical protein